MESALKNIEEARKIIEKLAFILKDDFDRVSTQLHVPSFPTSIEKLFSVIVSLSESYETIQTKIAMQDFIEKEEADE